MPMRQHSAGEAYRALREAPDTARITAGAREEFARRYPDLTLQPLVVVIAAYNEAENIGAVLDEIPGEIAGVPVTLLVIDDGSGDDTTGIARRHGALVCTLSANRGHGVALRLGYRISRESGARYIATLDGDGQWDPADLPAMVKLLEAGQADFVVGSRQLGRTENTDRFRNLGVRFFAWLIRGLTHTALTDTSSGLRVMRAEVTGAVRQTQPQYQTSELLIGAVFQGFRVSEVPTTMRQRLSGTTKKGGNVFYGLRYTRVIAKTWWRERRAPRHEHTMAGHARAADAQARTLAAGTPTVNGEARPLAAGTPTVNGEARPLAAGTPTVNGEARPLAPGTPTVNGQGHAQAPGTPTVNGRGHTQAMPASARPPEIPDQAAS